MSTKEIREKIKEIIDRFGAATYVSDRITAKKAVDQILQIVEESYREGFEEGSAATFKKIKYDQYKIKKETIDDIVKVLYQIQKEFRKEAELSSLKKV